MKIDNSFTVSAPIERAWEILNDIPTIAPCMPGAVLTSSEGDTHEGKVKIKVGPITSEYKGKAVFLEKDEANHKLVIKGEGRDTRGAGNANADITLTMKANGDRTDVNVDTDLKITGKVAQFGRGVIVDISQKLLGQFVDCLEQKISTLEEDAAKIAGASAEVADAGDNADGAAGGAAAAAAGTAGAMGIGKAAAGDVDVSDEHAATSCFPGGAEEAAAVAGGITDKVPDLADKASGLKDGATGAVSGLADKAGALGGAGVAGAAAAAAGAGAMASGAAGKLTGGASSQAEEPEALDLMDLAGGAVYKRLIPVAIVGVIILAIVLWLLFR